LSKVQVIWTARFTKTGGKMVNGKCKLCNEEATLMHSHIFPKFIFNWIKKSGSGYLRSGEDFNIRRQDGWKAYILCAKCEDRFSKLETYFSKSFFHPVVSGGMVQFQYDERLFQFVISIIWRILHYSMLEDQKGFFSYHFLQNAEGEWRDYLLGRSNLVNFNKLHLLIGVDVAEDDPDVEVPSKFVQYMARSVDSGCTDDEKSYCIAFIKIPRFLFIIPLSGFDESQVVKTEVFSEGGSYDINSAVIQDPNISGMLLNRVKELELALQKMSVNQLRTIEKLVDEKWDDFADKDLGEVIQHAKLKKKRK
jgi:hypothetical protein